MSHEIEEHDIVLSIEGTEWHGLATQVEQIGDAEIAPLLVPLIEGKPSVTVEDGTVIQVDGYKTILADIRERKGSVSYVPLHTPKDSYRIIENAELWRMVVKSIEGLGCKVTTAGTLGNMRKFFISVDLQGDEMKTTNGDKFLAYLNILTSHDGTITVEIRDSMIRVVCMNTFKASRFYDGEINVSIPHTVNAGTRLDNMAEYLQNVLSGREKIIDAMNMLISQEFKLVESLYIASAFLTEPDAKYMSTRTFNRAQAIRDLAKGGKGNSGKTRYDLFNGLTEYFTHGEGAGGIKADKKKKLTASQFGQAAAHKENFLSLLLDENAYQEALARGEKLYKEKATDIMEKQ